MSRTIAFSSPLLLGFEDMERLLERAAKTQSDGYPPYNIERIARDTGIALRITFAVAGFRREDLEVLVEEQQLVVRGRQNDDNSNRHFLHRGIATRQFQRAFVMAEGIEVTEAQLENGLLSVDLLRPEPISRTRRVEIVAKD